MTLILTAIYRDGICICADRRYVIIENGVKRFEDNHHKIYKFRSMPSLAIFNHGINKINGKYWDSICSDYEKTSRYKSKDLKSITDDFKNFIEDDVLRELDRDKYDSKIGFDLCGKTPLDLKFAVYELFWEPRLNSQDWCGPRLIITGDGKKFLDGINEPNWEELDSTRIKTALVNLFSIATNKQKSEGKQIFSENFDIECI
jgi:hypothetical protein